MSARPDLAQAADVQRIVLCEHYAEHVIHLVASFVDESQPRRFLHDLAQGVTRAGDRSSDGKETLAQQMALGLTYRGLKQLDVPDHVLAQFRARAPAFAAGAALRAAMHLGDTGDSAAPNWDPMFGIDAAHAVITIHAHEPRTLDVLTRNIRAVARGTGVMLHEELRGSRLGQPGQQWVHFGYRDGLSHVAIKGWSEREKNRFSHEPGEFLLGYANDHGVNPWVLASSPLPVREFFRNGSFGVLRQMQQHVDAFEDFVQAHAEARVRTLGSEMEEARAYIKAKLCGRWPSGSRFEGAEWDRPGQTNPLDEFDYAHDPEGLGCPFGSHVRRMNPRSEDTLHARHRPLLRRGMPYGKRGEKPCGLLGLFFCASIEDQFEHLLGHWGEGVPLGSLDGGSAKDPLFGQHADPRAVFEIPGAAEGLRQLKDLRPFVLTRGTVYAFYPGLATLKRIVSQDNVKYFREEDPVEPRA